MSRQVFIAYSFQDKQTADDVCRCLEESGVPCWMAPRDIMPGAEWGAAVLEAIRRCRVMVLLLSSRSDSRSVLREVERAISLGRRLVPVLIEESKLCPQLEYFTSGLTLLNAVGVPIEETVRTLVPIVQGTADPEGSETHDASEVAETGEGGLIDLEDSGEKARRDHLAYDVFISYRRDRDGQMARLVRSELRSRGFKVFLDVDDLRPGHFDEALLERIREASTFLLILSAGSLDRCVSPDDWLRKETACALAAKKTIIPILMPGFSFPEDDKLPQELRPIRVHHGVTYSHEFFDAMMEKIAGYLRTVGTV